MAWRAESKEGEEEMKIPQDYAQECAAMSKKPTEKTVRKRMWGVFDSNGGYWRVSQNKIIANEFAESFGYKYGEVFTVRQVVLEWKEKK